METDKIEGNSNLDVFCEDGRRKVDAEKLGTLADQRDMYRMGKTPKLRRSFGFFSIFGFSMILLSTWETSLGAAIFALPNGGTAGMIYVYLGTALGFAAVVVSMAEMASMAPTAGGQYHWVSEFAPKSWQKFLSYVVGWLCVLGWQTGSASSSFLAGTVVQALATLNYPEYGNNWKHWQGTLIVIGMAGIMGIFNTFLARKLPLVEGTVLILHILGFFAIIIPLWILAPRAPAHLVFTQFQSNGWSSSGLACLVGILSPTVSLLGSDAATHMSEELKDASYVLPRAMIATAVFNGSLGFIMVITLCFCLPSDPEAFATLLSSPPASVGYPFVQAFADGVQSTAGASAMTTIIIILSTFCGLTNIATASRQLFAFARDQGVPFSAFFAYVPPGWDIPLNAVCFTLFITIVLSLVNIGSQTAYNNITSLGVNALLSSYIISISCVCIKRMRGEPLLHRRFNLGRAGLAVNVFSVVFLLFVFSMCFFPSGPRPELQSMNWSVLIYGGVIIFSLVYYYLNGRRVYVGPVEYVRKDQ